MAFITVSQQNNLTQSWTELKPMKNSRIESYWNEIKIKFVSWLTDRCDRQIGRQVAGVKNKPTGHTRSMFVSRGHGCVVSSLSQLRPLVPFSYGD